MQTNIRDSLLRERLMAALSGFFGALATLLAMMGLFGVMSNSVARRTGEIGLRIALGAQQRNILGMVLGEAGTMLLIGLAIGAALALILGKTAGAMLFGLKPYDPLTILLSAIALAAVAILLLSTGAPRSAARSHGRPPRRIKFFGWPVRDLNAPHCVATDSSRGDRAMSAKRVNQKLAVWGRVGVVASLSCGGWHQAHNPFCIRYSFS